VPANLVAWRSFAANAHGLRLSAAGGAEVPLELKREGPTYHVVVPKAPLAPGTYQLEFDGSCVDLADGRPVDPGQPVRRSIEVLPAATLPTKLGHLEVVDRGVEADGRTVFARVRLVPPSDAPAWFLSVLETEVLIDGQRTFGQWHPLFVGAPSAQNRSDERPDEIKVSAACGSRTGGFDQCGLRYIAKPGKVAVTFKARALAGGEAPAAASTVIDLPCDEPTSAAVGCALAPPVRARIGGGLLVSGFAFVTACLARRRRRR
jgi:hypothetical protein